MTVRYPLALIGTSMEKQPVVVEFDPQLQIGRNLQGMFKIVYVAWLSAAYINNVHKIKDLNFISAHSYYRS